ncbi:MAG: hypothetical protein HYY25_11650 [Candidatus Wallbacteria bacterium]|nr:hypothetical protein [Candidatus Wallbacteria bacterium]
MALGVSHARGLAVAEVAVPSANGGGCTLQEEEASMPEVAAFVLFASVFLGYLARHRD